MINSPPLHFHSPGIIFAFLPTGCLSKQEGKFDFIKPTANICTVFAVYKESTVHSIVSVPELGSPSEGPSPRQGSCGPGRAVGGRADSGAVSAGSASLCTSASAAGTAPCLSWRPTRLLAPALTWPSADVAYTEAQASGR